MCGEKYFTITISALWAMSVFYGLYIALFGGSIYVLLYRRPNAYHLVASIALLLLTTAYRGIILEQVLGEPAVVSGSSVIGGTTVPCTSGTSERLHEGLTGDLLNVIIDVVSTCLSSLAEVILIHRCVVLWPHQFRHWIGVILGIPLLAETALGFAQAYYSAQIYYMERQQTPQSEGKLPPRWLETVDTANKLGTSSGLLTLAVNAISTILIALRIWFMTRQLEKTMGNTAGVRYRAAISMIVESGFMISALQLVMTCTILVNNSSVAFTASINLPSAIAPALIIVRVGMGRGFDSVVDTVHQHHASQGFHETQVKSIRFAERHTTTNISHITSFGAMTRDAGLESDGDIHSASNGSELSGVGAKAEKVEIAPDVV
ncbi:hypothetical protein EVG20_g6823 [Dentipellis fragilis]|uniref:Uncharacterized protein n=1 Tax=Dentipellis fragilis TaxID=205917 RepID=A0A4Y9YK70_9AGAM|nr:hypothetical protein EVG20_g6823 [Dentipellis fragilis]